RSIWKKMEHTIIIMAIAFLRNNNKTKLFNITLNQTWLLNHVVLLENKCEQGSRIFMFKLPQSSSIFDLSLRKKNKENISHFTVYIANIMKKKEKVKDKDSLTQRKQSIFMNKTNNIYSMSFYILEISPPPPTPSILLDNRDRQFFNIRTYGTIIIDPFDNDDDANYFSPMMPSPVAIPPPPVIRLLSPSMTSSPSS
ncbi:hypothetical protein DERP_002035, partial [Dermatophagoides pteronyssinus]